MTVIVTGVAGFIGFHVATALLTRGDRVIGIDNLDDYYDPSLKRARLAELEEAQAAGRFRLIEGDVMDEAVVDAAIADAREEPLSIIHLAARPGVRNSLKQPIATIEANVVGQTVILEHARRHRDLRHVVYASSSSVYGNANPVPFSLDDPIDRPASLYAASKRAAELITASYCELYGIPATGLRYFSVYGPWGRPDMAPYLFTRAIIGGEPIRVFNQGRMRRDFTYIADIVAGTLSALDRPPEPDGHGLRHRLYNLGTNRSVELMDFIGTIERAVGHPARMVMEPMQLGDVVETYADIMTAERDLGFAPSTSIEDGVPRFVDWYKRYHNVA